MSSEEKNVPQKTPELEEKLGGGTWSLEGVTRVTDRKDIPEDKNRNIRLIFIAILLLVLVVVAFTQLGGDKRSTAACQERWSRIENAMSLYYQRYKCFPPAYTTDRRGTPLHSWRTLLLPYLNKADVYEMIRLNEPWDSDFNRQFHSQMPIEFACAGTREQLAQKTHIQYVRGAKTVAPGRSLRNYESLRRPREATFLLVEASPAVHWMSPEDFDIKNINEGIVPKSDRTGLGGTHGRSFVALMVDGTVRVIDEFEFSKEDLAKMAEIE